MKASLFLISTAVCSATAQGFFETCPDWWMEEEEMYAWCYNKAGELVKSNENMDLCLWNDKGYLEGGNDGDFFATCGNCAPFLAPPPNTNQLTSALECDCIYDGQTYGSMFDLNTIVSNNDGLLYCYGHLAHED